MKYLTCILLFFTCHAFAQTDTLGVKPDTLLDQANLKLDSLEQAFSLKSDSLKQTYAQQKEKITRMKAGYQHAIDSLNSQNLPTADYTRKLDSLDQHLAGVQQKTTGAIDSLKGNIRDKLAKLELPKGAEGKTAKLGSVMDQVNVPSFDTDIADKTGLSKLNSALPTLPGTGNLPATNLPSADLPNVNTGLPGTDINVPDVKSSVPSTGINTEKINDLTGQAGDVQKQIQDATASKEGVGKALEDKASGQLKGLPEQKLPSQPGMPDGIPKTGDEAKAQLMEQAKKEAVNHFAGKEAALGSAMNKMSKYKQKYSSVNSLKDLPAKKQNELKGKPFIERVVPAITLQFQSWSDLMLDVNPSAGYRFTSHFTAGIGWNHRIAFNIPDRQFNPAARVYGIRTYGEYSFNKGFGFRLDIESMNTALKSRSLTSETPVQRAWVWSALVGIKQRYPIYKKLKGNAQLMYNLFDRDHRSPYTDRLNFRIGLEFAIRKKKKS